MSVKKQNKHTKLSNSNLLMKKQEGEIRKLRNMKKWNKKSQYIGGLFIDMAWSISWVTPWY